MKLAAAAMPRREHIVPVGRFAEPLPPIEMRDKIARRHSGLPLLADAPAYPGFPGRLYWRLIKARVAMMMWR